MTDRQFQLIFAMLKLIFWVLCLILGVFLGSIIGTHLVKAQTITDPYKLVQPVYRFDTSQSIVTQYKIDKYDTVKVVMLISDTSAACGLINTYISWIFGYEVLERVSSHSDYYARPVWRWKHYKYLSARKKPLRRSIIIWQTINTNPQ